MGGCGATVLVVDDDTSLRLLCRINLELDGHAVFEAANLGAARAVLAAERVDVVLLDVHVGGDDGLELARAIRTEEARPAVALMTGSAVVDSAQRATVDAVIAKPFSLAELSSTVRTLAEP